MKINTHANNKVIKIIKLINYLKKKQIFIEIV